MRIVKFNVGSLTRIIRQKALQHRISVPEIRAIIDLLFFYFGIHKFGYLPGHSLENLKFQKFSPKNKIMFILAGILTPYISRKLAHSKSKKRIVIFLRWLNSQCSKVYNVVELFFFLSFLKTGSDFGSSQQTRSTDSAPSATSSSTPRDCAFWTASTWTKSSYGTASSAPFWRSFPSSNSLCSPPSSKGSICTSPTSGESPNRLTPAPSWARTRWETKWTSDAAASAKSTTSRPSPFAQSESDQVRRRLLLRVCLPLHQKNENRLSQVH